jgi:response regulator NasT
MYRAKVFLACADADLQRRIRFLLLKEGYQAAGEAEGGAETLRKVRALRPEIIILEDDLPGSLEVLKVAIDDYLGGVVLLTSTWSRELSGPITGGGIISFVLKPVRAFNLLAAVEACLAGHRRVMALEEEINRLKDRLETRKVVEKAKGILMQTLGLTEQEAYRRIQRQSMDRCTSMRAIAEAIILAHEVKGTG